MSMSPRTLPGIVLIVGLALVASPASAWAAPAPFDLSQLMFRFSAIKTASAHFTERRYLHMLRAPLDDSGVLIYAAPDKLQKNTLLPDRQNLSISGDTVTIEREGKAQTLRLGDYPQIAGLIEGDPRDACGRSRDAPAHLRHAARRRHRCLGATVATARGCDAGDLEINLYLRKRRPY